MKHFIKEILKEKGLKVADLSKLLGITPQAMSYRLNGEEKGYIGSYQEIADALGVELWQLFIDPDKARYVVGDDFIAFVRSHGRTFEAMSLDELEMIVDSLRKGV